MELVYLWVEDYKNIHNQGFNFSEKFQCHYEYELNELSIKRNDDSLHIFPDNINITAICGKNGTGKSSILEYLYRLFRTSHEIYQYNKPRKFPYWTRWQDSLQCLIVLRIDGDLKLFGFLPSELPFQCNIKIDNFLKNYPISEMEELHNEVLTNFKLIGEEIHKASNILWFDYSFGTPYIQFDNHTYKEDFFENGHEKKFIIEPNKIFNNDNAINIRVEDEKNTKRMLNYFFGIHHDSSTIVDFFQPNIIELKINYKRLKLNEKNIFSKNLLELNRRYIDLHKNDSEYNVEINKAYKLANNIHLLQEVLDINSQFNIEDKIFFDIEIKTLRDNKDFIQIIEILSSLPRYLTLDLVREQDNISQRYSMLSSGEKGLLKILGNIDYHLQRTDAMCIYLFLDEIELYLHPEWQKKFLIYLTRVLAFFKSKKIFCILTTHSPFLLSDMPSQNIVFLDRNSDGSCKVIDGLNDKKQTFGANIHTLLSDAFFMKDGLIGEFAKEKINQAISYLNKKQLSEDELSYCEDIISIIGEPILKRQLQKMLDSKKLSEIEHIKKQIEELQKQLSEHQHA